MRIHGPGASWAPFLLIALAGMLGTGCEGERPPLPGSDSSAPPRQAAPPPTAEVGGELPLKLEGIGSKTEMDRALARIDDPETRAQFESGFRKSFVTDRTRRGYPDAVRAMEAVLEKMPGFAPAYRVLAYARLNISFDMDGALDLYQKAVEADPEYGEAHYGLAFMLTQYDRERGRKHFEKAMELGVPDERNLRKQFYADAAPN